MDKERWELIGDDDDDDDNAADEVESCFIIVLFDFSVEEYVLMV